MLKITKTFRKYVYLAVQNDTNSNGTKDLIFCIWSVLIIAWIEMFD